MGNFVSSTKSAEKEFNNFYEIIDFISSYYILTMDFKSMQKLTEKDYCDKLVVLTSDIFDKYLTETEVTYLHQRTHQGVEINTLENEKLRYFNKDTLQNLDILNDKNKSIKKKRVCIGIAKFYIKIAHIFSAIMMTINPVYSYKDATGQKIKVGFMQKDTIPKSVERTLEKLNVCDNRIRALKRNEFIDKTTGDVTINPKVCDINEKNANEVKSLEDEPGIKELVQLYYDDQYDYSTGQFLGMSESTKSQYDKDLKTFYTAFTGNSEIPSEVKGFKDIKLRDYSKNPGCSEKNPKMKMKYTLKNTDQLFIKYANNINTMIQNAADNQHQLLSVINILFTYVYDPYNKEKKVIRINPNLTDNLLQKAVENTRKLIINLYVKCEEDYTNGIKIYEAIVESKILETTEKQITTLKNEAQSIIKDTNKLAEEPPPVIINEPQNMNPISQIKTPSVIEPPSIVEPPSAVEKNPSETY